MSMRQREPRERLRLVVNIVLLSIGFISSLITIFTILTPFLKTTFLIWLIPLQGWLIPLSFFVLGVCVTFLGNAVYNYIYQQFRPFRWLLYGYRWVNAEYQYCIEDDTKLQHTQLIAITIKAIRRGVSIFENKYLWSGHGKQESLEILSTGHELLFSTTRQEHYFPYNRWKYYYVYVGHELPMKQDVIVNIKQVLYDDEGRFEPYVSKTITEPLESLKLRVLLPENLSFTNAFNNEFDHIGPNNKKIKNEPNPSRIVREKGNLYKELYYEIQKPHRNHKYEIRWEWVK